MWSPLLLSLLSFSHAAPISAAEDFMDNGWVRFSSAVYGDCLHCNLLPQVQWYLPDELLALRAAPAANPVRPEWLQQVSRITADIPILLAAPDVIQTAQLQAQSNKLILDSSETRIFALTEQFPLNQSFWNAKTTAYFQHQPLRLRGTEQGEKFVAQTVWPKNFRLPTTADNAPVMDKSLEQLVRQADPTEFSAQLLWSNADTVISAANQAVLALMLNGAQGDDHEALAGHFAIVTGRMNAQGDLHHWLVNNFYSLDIYSEKDIVAAVTPMDNYLADLNRGQNYYRPSYMLVATLQEDAPVEAMQNSLEQMLQHFYRHDYLYAHAQMNCAGITLDTARALGWQVPEQAHHGRLKAIAAYFYLLITDRDIKAARQIYDYLTTEKTRLLPAVAFDAMGNDLLTLAQRKPSRPLTSYETALARAIDTLWFVTLPQIPSSRQTGQAPIYSFDEYLETAPANRNDWISIELASRRLPEALKTEQPVNPAPFPVPWPIGLILFGVGLVAFAVIRRIFKRQ